MRSLLTLLLLLVISGLSAQVYDYDKSVRLEAVVDPATPSIQLNWAADAEATNYTIYRRLPGEASWGSPLATLDATAEFYWDEDVEVGVVYEYRVARSEVGGIGNGYMYAGMEIPATAFRGRMLLVVDETQAPELSDELALLEADLRADGWHLTSILVHPDDAVADVKDQIISWYDFDPIYSRAVYLFGHIPVPYSGNIGPDGHSDHVGAWPADVFYADMDGVWTDNLVNNVTASQARNHNVPGDGKYDNSLIASDLELMIGRVDFHNLPAFADSETELLRKYILKSHAFKTRAFTPVRRALIENNFAGFEEGFGQNGQKNFAPMFGIDSVSYLDYSTLYDESYLCSYGCGGGSYTSASGIGSTSGFASDSLQTVFTMLFGSYFGDWDSQNNFLRAALGSGTTLTNAWAARPNWAFHPMAIGYPIGYCARLSQNNLSASYEPGFGYRQVHAALMGDPSLRLFMVAPPSDLIVVEENGHAILSWDAAPDSLLLYNIYRKRDVETMYELVNPEPVAATAYVDSCLTLGETYDYYVKSVQLETSASGTYYNESLGIPGSVSITIDNSVTADFDVQLTGLNEYQMVNNSVNGVSYLWEFGSVVTSTDYEPLFITAQSGTLEITLYAFGECGVDSITQVVSINSIASPGIFADAVLHPNPASGMVWLDCPSCTGAEQLRLLRSDGRLVKAIQRTSDGGIDLQGISAGLYFIELRSEQGRRLFRLILD